MHLKLITKVNLKLKTEVNLKLRTKVTLWLSDLYPRHCKFFLIFYLLISQFFILQHVQSLYSLEGFVFVSKSANVPNHTPKIEKGHDF